MLDPPPGAAWTAGQRHALQLVRSGQNAFIVGEGGTGKSMLMTHIRKEAEHNGMNVAITSLTGVSAARLGGRTLHSWAGVGRADKPVHEYIRMSRWRSFDAARARWQLPRLLLLIDEVMMCPARLFALLEELARHVRDDPRPFGGIQVVAMGDPGQLDPVEDDGAKQATQMTQLGANASSSNPFTKYLATMPASTSASTSAPSAPKLLCEHPALLRTFPDHTWVELARSMRHRGDTAFAALLARARTAALTTDDHRALASRVEFRAPASTASTEMCFYREQAARINRAALARLPEPEYTLRATLLQVRVDRGKGGGGGKGRGGLAASILPLDTSAASPITSAAKDDYHIDVRLGAALLMTKNRQALGFMNGTRATLLAVGGPSPHWDAAREQWTIPPTPAPAERVVVDALPGERFRESLRVGPATHATWPDAPPSLWVELASSPRVATAIEPETEVLVLDQPASPYARNWSRFYAFTQYPVLLAHAITVHKAQGMELDSIRAHLGAPGFSRGQVYTLLSRCTRLSGVSLSGYRPEVWANQASRHLAVWTQRFRPIKRARATRECLALVWLARAAGRSLGARVEQLANLAPLLLAFLTPDNDGEWTVDFGCAPDRFWPRVMMAGCGVE